MPAEEPKGNLLLQSVFAQKLKMLEDSFRRTHYPDEEPICSIPIAVQTAKKDLDLVKETIANPPPIRFVPGALVALEKDLERQLVLLPRHVRPPMPVFGCVNGRMRGLRRMLSVAARTPVPLPQDLPVSADHDMAPPRSDGEEHPGPGEVSYVPLRELMSYFHDEIQDEEMWTDGDVSGEWEDIRPGESIGRSDDEWSLFSDVEAVAFDAIIPDMESQMDEMLLSTKANSMDDEAANPSVRSVIMYTGVSKQRENTKTDGMLQSSKEQKVTDAVPQSETIHQSTEMDNGSERKKKRRGRFWKLI